VRLLTDTHALVWALSDPDCLGARARAALAESDIVASVANLWELCLKAGKKECLIAQPEAWWDRYVTHTGISVLPIRVSHVLGLSSLPEIHRDPFDRILIAQSVTEKRSLIT
jgi:PIN domain nuclease of toxin-antitoxin system